jgi:hypothetical protein
MAAQTGGAGIANVQGWSTNIAIGKSISADAVTWPVAVWIGPMPICLKRRP